MGLIGAVVKNNTSLATLEQFKGAKHSTVVVGTTVTAVPATNLSRRKAVIFQNTHGSQYAYLGSGIPDIYVTNDVEFAEDRGNPKELVWRLSGGASNEWYATTKDNGDPGLTETKYLYWRLKTDTRGSFTLATNGAVGALASQGDWDWGDNDSLGFNTIYVLSDGATNASDPNIIYDTILGYTFTLTADSATTGGHKLGALDSVEWTVDGGCQIFCIASGASTPVSCIELI